MLVIISDLHFVDGTSGDHNLPFEAFSNVFLTDIAALAAAKAKELTLLLLGDIVDLNRSTKWFDAGVELKDRPWGENGLRDIPTPRPGSLTEQVALKILGQASDEELSQNGDRPDGVPRDTILGRNWRTFKLFRELRRNIRERTGDAFTVTVNYVPGNHDRLCNLYPSLRRELRRLLGLGTDWIDGDPGGDWKYRYWFASDRYKAYACHGHWFDDTNYVCPDYPAGRNFLDVPVGDVFTTEFGTYLPYALEHDQQFDIPGRELLIEKLRNLDNVRPVSSTADWLLSNMPPDSDAAAKFNGALERAMRRITGTFYATDAFTRWRDGKRGLTYLTYWLLHFKTLVEAFNALTSAKTKLGLINKISGDDDSPDNQYARGALAIAGGGGDRRFVVLGHTHAPLQQPLRADGAGGEQIYINTGTWRNRITRTMDADPRFIELKQMTYAVLYGPDEDVDNKEPGTVSAEVWTGAKKKRYLAG